MSGYPDDFNAERFDATIGSRVPPVEIAWEGNAARVNDAVTRAYKEYPLNNPSSAFERCLKIGGAMDKVDDAMRRLTTLTSKDKADLLSAYNDALRHDGDQEMVRQMVGDYMHIYQRAIWRETV